MSITIPFSSVPKKLLSLEYFSLVKDRRSTFRSTLYQDRFLNFYSLSSIKICSHDLAKFRLIHFLLAVASRNSLSDKLSPCRSKMHCPLTPRFCFSSSVFRVCSEMERRRRRRRRCSRPCLCSWRSDRRNANNATDEIECPGRAVNPGYRQCSIAFTSNSLSLSLSLSLFGNGNVSLARCSYFGRKFHQSPGRFTILETRIGQTLYS